MHKKKARFDWGYFLVHYPKSCYIKIVYFHLQMNGGYEGIPAVRPLHRPILIPWDRNRLHFPNHYFYSKNRLDKTQKNSLNIASHHNQITSISVCMIQFQYDMFIHTLTTDYEIQRPEFVNLNLKFVQI